MAKENNNKNNIKVSVVVPVFNTEKYLGNCLDSLVNQTLAEIEILVVIDAANPDESEIIAGNYEKKYPMKLKVLHAPAGRLGDNRNFGMDHAAGQFVAFVDSDDYVALDMYEKLYERAVTESADIVACGICRIFYAENKVKNDGTGSGSGTVLRDPNILQKAKVYAWNKLFNMEFVKKNNFRFPSFKGFEDAACIYNILLCAEKIALVNEPLYMYRWQREGYASHANDERMFDAIKACKLTCAFYKEHGGFDKSYDVLEKFCFDRIFYRFDHIYKDVKARKMGKAYIKEAFAFMNENFNNWKSNYQKSFFVSAKQYAKTHKWFSLVYLYIPKNFRKWWGSKTEQYKTGKKNYIVPEKQLKGVSYYLHCVENYSIENQVILYDSHEGLNMVCHPFAIFLEITRQDNKKAYKHVWVINNQQEQERLLKKYSDINIEFVVRNSKEFKKYLATARYLISNVSMPSYFMKRDNQLFIETWHGIPFKTLGCSQSDGGTESFNTVRTFLHADYILSPNEHMKRVYLDDYKLKNIFEGEFMDDASPRDEYLMQDKTEAVYDSLEELGVKVDRNKKIILFVPTWRGTKTAAATADLSPYIRFKEKLEKVIDMNQYQLLIKLHHLTYRQLTEEQIAEGNYISMFMNPEELLSITDILISDYSSIAFDFLYTGRQMIYYIEDLLEYTENHGLYFNTNELPGPVTDDPAQVGKWINSIDSVQEKYKPDYDRWCKLLRVDGGMNKTKDIADLIIKGTAIEDCDRCISSKKRILIYAGKLRNTEIIERLFGLINHLDLDKFDITVIDDCTYWERQNEELKYVVRQLKEKVRIIGREAGGKLMSDSNKTEWKKMRLEGVEYAKLSDEFHKYLKYEIKRNFSDTKFDAVIDFSGQDLFYSLLMLEFSEAVKIFWCQNFTEFLPDNLTKKSASILNIMKNYDYIIGRTKSVSNRLSHLCGTESDKGKFVYIEDYVDSQRHKAEYIQLIEGQYVGDNPKQNWIAKNESFNLTLYPRPNLAEKNYVTEIVKDNSGRINSMLDGFKKYIGEGYAAKLYIICSEKMREKMQLRVTSKDLSQNVVLVDRSIDYTTLFLLSDCFIYLSMGVMPIRTFFVAKEAGMKIIAAKFLAEKNPYNYDLGDTIEGSITDFFKAFIDFENGNLEVKETTTVKEFNEEITARIENLLLN